MTVVPTRVQLVETLRQDVDLKRRSANLDQRRGEAGERAPQEPHRRMRAPRLCRRPPEISAKPGSKPGVEHERQRDRSHGQLDRGVGEIACEQPGHTDAEDRAGQQHLQVPATPFAPIGPHRDGVLADEDRQQDGGAFERRHDQRDKRCRDHAEADEAALAKAEQRHRGNGHQVEQRIGDHWKPAIREDIMPLCTRALLSFRGRWNRTTA